MLLEYMKRYEKRTIVSSILMAVIAILLIIEPETMLNTVMLILGIGILIDGLISVIVYIFTDKEQRAFSNSLVEGTLALVIAILILTNKKIMISIIPIIIGRLSPPLFLFSAVAAVSVVLESVLVDVLSTTAFGAFVTVI